MADKKISQLTPATTPLAGTEVLPIVQSGSTVKVSSDDLTVKNVRSNATTGILQVAGPGAGATRTMTVPDANFTAARTDAGQTFTGTQVMTSPQIVTGVNDVNGNEFLKITATASAVNELTVTNAATGNAPRLSATGDDTNIDLRLLTKGSGNLQLTTTTTFITPATNTDFAYLRHSNAGGTTYVGLDSSVGGLYTAYGLNIWHRGNYPIVFGTNDTYRGRWDTSGNLRIGNGNLVVDTAGKGIEFAGGLIWCTGTGTPEGAVTAPVGSLFTRTDGGANTTLYVKESGAGNTGWVAK